LEAAHLLLKDPSYSLSDVADRMHFSSQANFTNWFRRVTNTTPGTWRSSQL
jgi:AraC-like DNA-binding protein